MRGALALTAGFLPLLSGQHSYAQELPVFDDEDFQIVSVEPDSRVIARSDGRDFYCYADVEAAGYVLVWGCLPFVNRSETADADARYAVAVAAAAKAEADLAAAAEAVAARVAAREKAVAARVAAREKAEADAAALKAEAAEKAANEQAAKVAMEGQARFEQLFGTLDQRTAMDAVVAVARKYQCRLTLDNRTISNLNLLQAMWAAAALPASRFYDEGAMETARKWFTDGAKALENTGEVKFSGDGRVMILKDCK